LQVPPGHTFKTDRHVGDGLRVLKIDTLAAHRFR